MIHGQRYRPAPYLPTSRWQRLKQLLKLEFAAQFRTKWGIAIFLACLIPSLVRLVILLIWTGALALGGGAMRNAGKNAPQQMQELLPDRVEFYLDGVTSPGWGLVMLLVLTSLVTARAIAKDRATNALELYWTRGISPLGYFLGKGLGCFLLTSLMTVAAPFALWVMGVFLADDWSFLVKTWTFMPGVVLGLLVFTAVLTSICLLLSALATTPNLAAILWCLMLGGTAAVGRVAGEVLGQPVLSVTLSVFDAAGVLAHAIAGVTQRETNVTGSCALLGGIILLLAFALRRRLRLQEAIG